MAKKAKSKVSRTTRIAALALAVVLAILCALYAAARTFGKVPLSNLADVFVSFSAKQAGSFPYLVDSDAVVRMVSVGSGIEVLRTDRLDVLTRQGALLQSVQHTYTAPAVDVRQGRTLLYDRGGTRYMLLSKTQTLRTGETKQKILTAALDNDGKYAIATVGEGDKSLLTLYKDSGKAYFQYKCVSEYITDVAFMRGGVALTVAGVQNAEPYSRLLVLDVRKGETVSDTPCANTSLFHVHTDGRTAVACSSSMLTRVRWNEKLDDSAFGSDTLQYFCPQEDGRCSLVLLTYGNEHDSKVRGLHKNGETAFEADCGERILSASRSGGCTAVLTDKTVLTYNNSGAQIGTITLTRSARDVCLSERTAYVLFYDRIERFTAAGEHKQKEKS